MRSSNQIVRETLKIVGSAKDVIVKMIVMLSSASKTLVLNMTLLLAGHDHP